MTAQSNHRFIVAYISDERHGDNKTVIYNGRIFFIAMVRDWYSRLPEPTSTTIKNDHTLWQALLSAQWKTQVTSPQNQEQRAAFTEFAHLLDAVVASPQASGLIAAKRPTETHSHKSIDSLMKDFSIRLSAMENSFKVQESEFKKQLESQAHAFNRLLAAQREQYEQTALFGAPTSPSTLAEEFAELGRDTPTPTTSTTAPSEQDLAGIFARVEDTGIHRLLKGKSGGTADADTGDFEIVLRRWR